MKLIDTERGRRVISSLLLPGDKIIKTYHTRIPEPESTDVECTVTSVTNATATVSDGGTLYKVKRDVSNGVVQIPRDRRAFRSSWITFKVSDSDQNKD